MPGIRWPTDRCWRTYADDYSTADQTVPTAWLVKQTAYIETSIFSFYYARRTEPAAIAMRDLNHFKNCVILLMQKI